MNNPFELIEARLNSIETLILDIKHQPVRTGIPQKENEDNYLTVQETAKFLSLSVATIYSKCSRGELTYFKQGKRLYFSQKGLSEYLKQGRVKSNDELQAEAALYTLKKKGGRV